VYTCDTIEERSGKQGLIEAVQFFFMSMKKWEINPIGPLVVEYLREHALSLYDYLLKKKPNEELVAEDIMDDIDKHFCAGFVLHWDVCLNDGGLWHYPRIERVCWVFILNWGTNKAKGTLLQELQSKCDTSWMGHWTEKILTFHDKRFHV
jgi:hypothetical protein